MAQGLRHEVRELFGLRWETAIEWVVIGWISAWYWFVVCFGFGGRVGPVTAILRAAEAAHIGAPMWLTHFASWLGSFDTSLPYGAAITVAVVAVTSSVRDTRTGLRVIAYVALALALDIKPSWTTVLIMFVGASSIALVASMIGGFGSEARADMRGVTVRFVAHVLYPLFILPVVAPLAVFVLLTEQYTNPVETDASVRLAEDAAKLFWSATEGSLETSHASTMALVAAITSLNNPDASRRIASSFYWRFAELREASEQNAKSGSLLRGESGPK